MSDSQMSFESDEVLGSDIENSDSNFGQYENNIYDGSDLAQNEATEDTSNLYFPECPPESQNTQKLEGLDKKRLALAAVLHFVPGMASDGEILRTHSIPDKKFRSAPYSNKFKADEFKVEQKIEILNDMKEVINFSLISLFSKKKLERIHKALKPKKIIFLFNLLKK